MAVHHLTITLTGAAQPILATAGQNCRELQLESETGNADVKVGGSGVTATDYGRTIEAGPSKAVIIRPSDGNLSIGLNTTYLFGTANQKVHVLYTQ